jgi:HD-GYP domain-containing protein (c-di-GMP phosphodiesterase class II)
MNDNDAVTNTFIQLESLVQPELFPKKEVPDDGALREDYEKLRITYELQRDIGSEIEIDSILKRILDRTSEFLKYDRGVILLMEEGEKLRIRASKTVADVDVKNNPLSKTLIRYILKNRKGVISSDIRSDQRFNQADSVMLSHIRSSMAVPLLYQDEILGAIIVQSSEKIGVFSEKDLKIMMNIANHVAQFIKNSLLHEELRTSFNNAIRTLSAMVDARHPLTAGHSERVAKISLFIANELGLEGYGLEGLKYGALLHDIGKIGISDRVLLKVGPLDADEREEMNSHPAKTKEILDNFHFPRRMKDVPTIAALHHERVDGRGYPYGVDGSQFTLESKIIAVADVFDALTSPRDYPKYSGEGKPLNRDRMSIEEAVSVIEEGAGSQFEAEVVDGFKRCLPRALLNLRKDHYEKEYVDSYIRSRDPSLASRLA